MACFDNIALEDLDSCINTEIQAGISEVGIHYAVHAQVLDFPMPLNVGDPLYSYETAVAVTTPITFAATKGFNKITIQADSGEVTVDLVGNKGNKKTKSSFSFYVPGNDKKLLGFVRTLKNVPLLFCVPERNGQKRMIGDKFNPAYMSEVKGTTGKGGEDDKGIQFTIESFCIPIVYESTLQLPTVV